MGALTGNTCAHAVWSTVHQGPGLQIRAVSLIFQCPASTYGNYMVYMTRTLTVPGADRLSPTIIIGYLASDLDSLQHVSIATQGQLRM